MSECTNPAHPKFNAGALDLCLLCHYGTDRAFAVYSQTLLARIKAQDALSRTNLMVS
jgi:hypothetical protein